MTVAAVVALLLLFAVVAILAIIGGTGLFPAIPGQRVVAPPQVNSPDFISDAALLLGESFSADSDAEILCNGDETFPRLWADLEGAKREIRFLMYYAESGRVADRTFSILERKAREGVRVRFLYDSVGFRGLDGGYLDALRRADAAVHPMRPLRIRHLYRFNHRVHARLVNVDGQAGYTGAFGVSDRWEGDGVHDGAWRDTSARLSGPALRQLDTAFATLWMEAAGELIPALCAPGAAGKLRAILLHSSPGIGSTSGQRLWALTLAAAQRQVFLASGYFAPARELLKLPTSAASRGVDVRLLTARAAHTDIPPAYWAGRATYLALLQAGVRIWEYAPSMMHAKTVVVDGRWSAVGAINYDNRSVVLNDEAALLVYDTGFGARMDAIFEEDLTRAREVTAEEVGGSGWSERAKAYIAYRFVRIL